MEKRKTYLLVILDGFGYRQETKANAIANAHTPTLDRLLATYPHTLIATSGKAVGLPDGQMGNSEVGHMTLGAGRVVYQSFSRVNKAIEDGDFYTNTVLCDAVDKTKRNNSTLHIMGLLSPGGVHSHEDHFCAMIKLAEQRGAKKVMVHAFLDGRDTAPRSAENSLKKIDQLLHDTKLGHIASIVGRYYAMDRDQRWPRIEEAYNLLTQGQAQHQYATALDGLNNAYLRDESDEFVKPTRIRHANESIEQITVQEGDSVIFMNFRADRGRQLTEAFTAELFTEFYRGKRPQLAAFVTLTQYAENLEALVAFPPDSLHNGLGEYLANTQKTQLRIAETEKYAHVTFFFSGGQEDTFPGEQRILINSPQVATYDLQPEMSAFEVTDKLVAAIESGHYDFIACNYANGDMVGHTGNYQATVRAIEAIDQCLQRIETAILANKGECLITADHGNAEQLEDEATGQAHTSHTTGPVPLIYIGQPATLLNDGTLSDIAPTLLHLMQLPVPKEMTGRNLVQLKHT